MAGMPLQADSFGQANPMRQKFPPIPAGVSLSAPGQGSRLDLLEDSAASSSRRTAARVLARSCRPQGRARAACAALAVMCVAASLALAYVPALASAKCAVVGLGCAGQGARVVPTTPWYIAGTDPATPRAKRLGWHGRVELAQTHVVYASGEARHAPRPVRHRETELLFTPRAQARPRPRPPSTAWTLRRSRTSRRP